jgi:hypothetical protein
MRDTWKEERTEDRLVEGRKDWAGHAEGRKGLGWTCGRKKGLRRDTWKEERTEDGLVEGRKDWAGHAEGRKD